MIEAEFDCQPRALGGVCHTAANSRLPCLTVLPAVGLLEVNSTFLRDCLKIAELKQRRTLLDSQNNPPLRRLVVLPSVCSNCSCEHAQWAANCMHSVELSYESWSWLSDQSRMVLVDKLNDCSQILWRFNGARMWWVVAFSKQRERVSVWEMASLTISALSGQFEGQSDFDHDGLIVLAHRLAKI